MHTITCWLNYETQTPTDTKINAMKDLYFFQSLSTFMTYVFECDFSKWKQIRGDKNELFNNMNFKWGI